MPSWEAGMGLNSPRTDACESCLDESEAVRPPSACERHGGKVILWGEFLEVSRSSSTPAPASLVIGAPPTKPTLDLLFSIPAGFRLSEIRTASLLSLSAPDGTVVASASLHKLPQPRHCRHAITSLHPRKFTRYTWASTPVTDRIVCV